MCIILIQLFLKDESKNKRRIFFLHLFHRLQASQSYHDYVEQVRKEGKLCYIFFGPKTQIIRGPPIVYHLDIAWEMGRQLFPKDKSKNKRQIFFPPLFIDDKLPKATT